MPYIDKYNKKTGTIVSISYSPALLGCVFCVLLDADMQDVFVLEQNIILLDKSKTIWERLEIQLSEAQLNV